MLNKTFEAVDAMPFAGKFVIRMGVKSYIESDQRHEALRYSGTQALLVGMVAVHASQANLGVESLSSHINTLSSGEVDPLTLAATSVDAVYIAAMGLVAARQANLVARVEKVRQKRREKKEANTERQATKKEHALSGKAVLGAVAFTLAGQMLFMGSYSHAAAQQREADCIDHATSLYDEYDEEFHDTSFIPEDEYVDMICATD